jgi:hypothetical protein
MRDLTRLEGDPRRRLGTRNEKITWRKPTLKLESPREREASTITIKGREAQVTIKKGTKASEKS